MQKVCRLQKTAVSLHRIRNTNKNLNKKNIFTMQYYISKTKNAFNPCDTNTPDTFVSRGYDTENEAFAVLSKVDRKTYGDYCIVEYTPPKLEKSSPRQPFGI